MSNFKPDFNDKFYAFVTDADEAANAVQQGYALLEDIGDDLWPASRRRLEEAVSRLEDAMAKFEEDPWSPPHIEKVTLIQK